MLLTCFIVIQILSESSLLVKFNPVAIISRGFIFKVTLNQETSPEETVADEEAIGNILFLSAEAAVVVIKSCQIDHKITEVNR